MAYVPPAPATGRRKLLYRLGAGAGLGLMTLVWAAVIAGLVSPYRAGDIMSVIVLVALFTPFAALLDNPGERRTRQQRFVEFCYAWVLLSGVTQTVFDGPWFLLDLFGVVRGAGAESPWVWPWWVYGVADTRYLTSSPTIAGIELCAGIGGVLELVACVWFKRGRRIAANWLSLLVGLGLAWGTVIFFVAEMHVGFADVHGGAFGFWVKWFGLNLPWMVAPLVFIPGSIWDLAALYEDRALRRAGGEAVAPAAA